ncbi:mitochondrial ribosomal protein of the large subunit [Nadsonia fulvescens var. elongata DSM 6958]|uniref:Mitochondrial ribosomal protein of the large subunit n=1 Tax=Nadsonia fulvescens var. elongata DSM 6958 TaxID=857566 RepID=A0A1E3PKE4_9ASCO|nr:mitochondrial ribosomal protein of the large subunit [Nadsonia fulvescens var. elongata DSM 6958]
MVVLKKLGRTASARKSLMRNMVTSLIEHESITTTFAKAKVLQSYTDRLITSAKHNTPTVNTLGKVYRPEMAVEKLYTELVGRYVQRPGGYTRIHKVEPRLGDYAPQAIIELVDGKRDMKFYMTARVVARLERQGLPIDKTTQMNLEDVIRFRQNGKEEFRATVEEMKKVFYKSEESISNLPTGSQPASRVKKNVTFVDAPTPKVYGQ